MLPHIHHSSSWGEFPEPHMGYPPPSHLPQFWRTKEGPLRKCDRMHRQTFLHDDSSSINICQLNPDRQRSQSVKQQTKSRPALSHHLPQHPIIFNIQMIQCPLPLHYSIYAVLGLRKFLSFSSSTHTQPVLVLLLNILGHRAAYPDLLIKMCNPQIHS